MKKEFFIGCFLALLLTAALINIHFLNKLTDIVSALIEESSGYAQKEDWTRAVEKAEEAWQMWESSDTYTHLVLRHSEIEAATDSLFGYLEQVYAEESGAAKGAAKAVVSRLKSISSIEQMKLGSIF